MNIRLLTEERELETLSPRAVPSRNSKGRQREEEECTVRTAFQRDRDRIIHSKAFRRLSGKTQVFLSPVGDHYRTRLTHTLEVGQVARTIAKALRLNEDLTEAIALGHDLGHTPFGHSGEEVLERLVPGGFKHNEQSLRVVDIIEKGGLNLTWEVRDGIRHHTGDRLPATLEGRVARLSDRIAYINHDIDDALRAGIIRESDLPPDCIELLGESHSARISLLVSDVISASRDRPEILMSPAVGRAMDKLREYLLRNVYVDSPAKKEERKAKKLLERLFQYYLQEPTEIPWWTSDMSEDEKIRRVADYVSGMTDRFAIQRYQRHFVPSPWGADEIAD